MASASEEFQEKYATHRSGKVKVTILASEWGSSKGGLSTINRTLSIQLAKSSDVEISFFVPQCSEKDKTEALRHNIRIVEATQLVGYEELDLLSFPPDGLEIEVVIGHGVKLGRQAQVIKRSHRCKWVQVVHTDPEEIGMFKCYSDPISRGEGKHNDEVKLCEKADFVVGIGPKLAEAFRSYLRFCKSDRTILDFTPGIFEEFLSVEQVHEERNHRSVLVFGRGDVKDFKLKGFDIAGKAIASLIDTRLVFVGAPNGKHDEVKESFMQCGLSANHLRVRGYDNSRESLRQLFCEVDLVIMPSRTDGFGLTGLEALSAGLPVLVSKNSGFGEALCKVPLCSPFVIDSDNPDVWAAAIKNIIWDKDRHCRLDEANRMRILYDEKYSWPKQSDALRSKIIKLADACLLQLQIDAVAITAASAQKGTRTEVPSWKPQEVIQEVGEPSATKKQQTLINTGLATENCGKESIQSTQAVFNKIAESCFQHVDPSKPEQLNGFICYLERVHKVLFHHVETGSLIITVEVGSEEILEKLWQDYRKGHLNEMAQEFLVTEELLKEFGLIEFKLTTFISEGEYKACQQFFSEDKKRASCPEEEDAANIAVNVESSNDSHHPNSHLLPPDRYDWQTVPNRSTHDSSHTVSQYTAATETRRGHNRSRRAANVSVPRGFLSQRRPKRGQFNNSVASKADKKAPNQSEVVKRPERGQCGRGKRGRGRGREEQARRSGAGFIQPDIKYEWNQLYVLGLHYKTSQDSLKNYIHIISGYEVGFVRWFKPNGKAIVTLKTHKIKDFQDILRAQKKKPTLDGVTVLIERAPQCKSIYVSGFPPCTSKDEAQMYFEEGVGALDPARGVVFSPTWDEQDEKCRIKRAIVYFNDKESQRKALKNDHFLDDNALHVEAFYPFLGTVNPVDQPKGSTRPISSDPKGSRIPEFYKLVDPNLMEFIMESNQSSKLKGALNDREKTHIKWKNGASYALVKYAERKPDSEFEELAWKKRCNEIVDSCLDSCDAGEFPIDEEIWDEVANQLPQIERQVLSKYTAKVKLMETSHTLKLICLESNMLDFADKLTNRLKKIKQEVREKKMEEKIRNDISLVNLQLFQNAKIENILKEEFKEDVRAEVKLGDRALVLKTPKGLMLQVYWYLRQRLDEIDECAIHIPPEIVDLLQRKPGKRKMVAELPAGCAFTVDDKRGRVIFLGKNPPETKEGSQKAKSVLISDQSLAVTTRDNSLLNSDKWSDLYKKLEKRLKIKVRRELHCIAVFGFKKDVMEAVTKMRDFFNEKKATEGEFPLDSLLHRRIFNEFFKDDIEEMERELARYGVKISFDDKGELIKFSGSEEGVKEVEERLYALQETIKEKIFRIYTPGMRTFLAQEEGRRLIEMVEREKKCIINVTDFTGEEEGDDDEESESDESLSNSCDGDEIDENENTILTSEGKIVTWKTGNIQEEQADVLVCSVGSNLMLSVGAIANAMSKAAGPELQQALWESAKEATADLGEGDIIRTIPGKLPCRHVIHCICCPWKDGSNEQKQVLKKLLCKCFDMASEMGACSIGLPLIGTGGLGFPHAVAVHVMIQAAIDHSQTNPESPIEEFRFVVFSDDPTGIEAIEDNFIALKKERQPMRKYRKQNVPKRNPTPFLMPELENKDVECGQLKVRVVEGDITKESAEAICNVVFHDLDMRSGSLSSSIAAVCGNVVQEELQAQLPQNPGDILLTSAGRAAAMKKIVHIVVGSSKKKHLQSCVEKALKKADSEGLRSLSIPAVGSGRLGLSEDDSAEIVFAAIRAFTASPCASIREVKIVVQDDSITGVFVAKLEAIQKENSKSLYCEKNDAGRATDCGRGILEDSTDESATGFRRQNVVIHGRIESLEEAMTALKDGVTKACNNPRIIKHDVLSRLSKRRIKDLKRMSRDRDVKMEQPEACCIRLEGLPKDVMDLNTEISNIIQEQLEKEHKEEKAEQMFRTVRWCMTNAAGKEEPFDKIANYEIELAYQAKKPSLVFSHENLKAEIHFDFKEVTFLRNGKIKSIRRRDVLPLPDEWVAHPRDEQDKEEPLHLVSLLRESEEFRRIEDKFIESLSNKVNIINIERIQNPSLYLPYMARKQSMDEKNGTRGNELQLFHGTKYESVKPINLQGFNRRFCGQNGRAYGDGVYFAKEASYSKSFSKQGPHGECCMYLARVLVGKYTLGRPGMRAPPSRDKGKPEILFDSVVNDADNPTVFVVFNDCHVYPEYLITFKTIE